LFIEGIAAVDMGARMKARLLAALGLLGAAAAMATDILVIAGRWEVNQHIDYGAERPAGMPANEKSTDIHCLAKGAGELVKAPLPLIAEGCKVSNYRKEGSTVKFTAKCEEGNIEFAVDARATTVSGTAVLVTQEPKMRITVRFEGKRTGASCSAAELKEYKKYDEE
jgi:hypothetical protein